MLTYKTHEYADLFPLMSGAEFVDLKADIKQRGLLQPVIMLEGKILDGRNRFRACQEVGAEIKVVEYDGDDPLGDVISWNLKRRHLNEGQRSSVAAKLANMPRGGVRQNNPNHTNQTANLQFDPESLQESQDRLWADNQNKVTQTQAAEMLNVSPRSVADAVKVKESSPELFKAVETGDIAPSLAAKVIDLPDEDQELIEALHEEPEQMRKVARELVHNHRAQGTGENEWYTPAQYIEAARDFLGGFDLDPASSELANKTVQAANYFTINDNGLEKDWRGKVWLNPPYSQPEIRLFIEKVVSEYADGNVSEAIVLTHNYTDTAWFHAALSKASAVCFTRGRIGFVNPEGKKACPTQGQAFFYFGDHKNEFAFAFSDFGKTVFCESVS